MLQDILDAITAETDKQITAARSEHQRGLTDLREQSERRLSTRKQEIAVSKEQRKAQFKAKAEAHAESHKRNALLSKKRELLDRVYAKITVDLSKLSDDKAEKLLRACLKKITEKGDIFPSKKHEALLIKIAPSEQFAVKAVTSASGGFLFSSKTQENDFTFDHLVQEWLRPQTELDAAHKLFDA
ncbi:MAG: hypothetical protein O2904_03260 [bacterium]|nr:hypothetical protein [bacterium]